MRPFLANCPNHGDRLEGPLRAVFRLSRPTFSDATEPRPFWYGCWKLDNSTSWRTPEGDGFEKLPLRRSEPGSNHLVQVSASGRRADLSWGGFDRLAWTLAAFAQPAAAIGRDPLSRLLEQAIGRQSVALAGAADVSARGGQGIRLCGTTPAKLVTLEP